jgi:drug/metabolite transporter (DMT)-like permease
MGRSVGLAPWQPLGLALLSALLFGAATPISKGLLGRLTPFQLAGLLYLGAALGLAPYLLFTGRFRPTWRIDPRNRLRLAGAVILGGLCGPVALLFGLRLAAAASVSLWLNLELVATALLGHFLFHDELGRYGWSAAGGTLVGAVILSWGEGAAGVQVGVFVALACLGWGFDNHLTALIDGLTPEESTFWKGLVAGSGNFLIDLSAQPFSASPGVILGAFVLGSLSYGLSIVLYIGAAQRVGATRAQLLFATAPVFGVLLSIVLLGEPLTSSQLLAALILTGSLLLLFLDRHAHPHEHPAFEHEHWHRHDNGHHTHVHPGLPASLGHSHPHHHESVTHAHPHWPDLHHRHRHRGWEPNRAAGEQA